MENATTLSRLYHEVKKLRELQKRYWTQHNNNDAILDYKKKLLIMCKQQESIVDKCIQEVEDIQQDLAL